PELVPHLARAVDLVVLAVYAPDLAAKMFVPLDSLRPALRVCLTRAVFVVAGWRDLELATDRLDAVLGPVLVDEGVHQRVKRSSSAAAKKADALRRISFARLSSRFSRSSDLSRSLSSVVSPGRSPLSTSRRRTQFLSVSDEQPIFAAMEQMAAHWDPYSSWCSRTSRTARSRTSGERSEEHTSELQSRENLVCRLLLEK